MSHTHLVSDRMMGLVKRMRRANKFALVSSGAIVIVGFALLLNAAALAQQTYEGQWLIEAKPQSEKFNLSLRYHISKNKPDDNSGFNSNTSFDIALAQLSGLTPAQVMSATGGNVQFQLRRDPGDLNFEGWFKEGHGAGHFVFASSATARATPRPSSAPLTRAPP